MCLHYVACIHPFHNVAFGADGNGGSSFTRLAAVLELTTPLGLEYPRPTFPRPEEIRLGGTGSNRAPELTGSALLGTGLLDQINDDSDLISGLNVGQYFTDPDGNPLTFTANNLPPGLAINPVTGIIEGTLDSSASQGGLTGNGIYNVVITATDPYGASIDLPFTWTTLNPPPVAADDVNTTEENTVVVGNVLEGDPVTGAGRDIDPDGDKLTVIEITNGKGDHVLAGNPITGVNENDSKGGGSFIVNPDGSYQFDPGTDFDYLAEGETTTTTVSYKISDGDGGFDDATLTITVTGTNDVPVIKVAGTDDAATVTELKDGHEDENLITHTKKGVIKFDDKDDSDTHTIEYGPAPVAGQPPFLGELIAVLDTDKTINWTFNVDDKDIDYLAAGETLTQKYVVTIDDGKGGTVEQTVTITIIGTNDAPIIDAGKSTIAGAVTEDDADKITADGTLVWGDADNRDTHTWEVVANKDADGNSTAQTNGQYGKLEINDDGVWIYTLNNNNPAVDSLPEGGTLTDTITVLVDDGNGGTDEQVITITITGTNDIPVLDTQHDNYLAEGMVKESGYLEVGTLTTTGQLIATDVDTGDTLTWSFDATDKPTPTVTLDGVYGSITLNPATGVWTYSLNDSAEVTEKLNKGMNPEEVFTAYVSDGKGGVVSQDITVTVQGTNDAPVAVADEGSVSESGVLTTGGNPNATFEGTLEAKGNVLSNDTDIDSAHENLKVTEVSFSQEGIITATGTVGSPLNGKYGNLQLNEDGTYTYTLHDQSDVVQSLKQGQTETETFNYTVVDEHGAPHETTLTITVTGTNDQPTITTADDNSKGVVTEQGKGAEDATPIVKGELTAEDVDAGHVLSWGLQSNPDQTVEPAADGGTKINGKYGWLTLGKNGQWTYELDNERPDTQALKNGETPTEIFTARVTDEHGAYAEQSIVITVNGTNDAPVAKDDTVSFKEDLPNPADPKGVETLEDNSKALGLTAPVVTDKIDHNGIGEGDNPELLGLITLSGIPDGVQLLDGDGKVLWTSTGENSPVTINLSDGHTDGNGHIAGAQGDLTLTKAQFESLLVNPKAHDGDNFTVTVSVDSYEVDASGKPLAGIDPANTTVSVGVDVQAVTDDVVLTFVDDGTHASFTINEDKRFNVTKALKAAFEDLDGSEERDIVISGLPAGSKVIADNHSIKIDAEGNFTIHAIGQTGGIDSFPKIEILPPSNFSGDIKDIKVTLNAKDTDKDSTHDIASKSAEVTLDLHVNPVAGDITVGGVSGNEDTAINFLKNVKLTDKDGSEVITHFIVKDVPEGWVVKDEDGNVISPNADGNYALDPNLLGTTANGNLENYQNWTVTPPAHSSKDATFKVDVTTVDTSEVNGETVTHTSTKTDLPLKVTVKPVAETVGGDTDKDGQADLTMTSGTTYTNAVGKEDAWFAINQDGFKLGEGWSNQDGKPTGGFPNTDSKDGGTEATFAVLTPVLVSGATGDSAAGAQFRYKDPSKVTTDNPEGYVVLTFNGKDSVEIPMEFLDSVEFLPSANVSGTFDIKVQAKTVDTDADGNGTSTAISGEAWLKGIVIDPVADLVTLGIGGAHGKEDTEIPLIIRPSSDDPSETFNVTISGIPQGAELNYGGDIYRPKADGSIEFVDFDSGKKLTITPPLHSDKDFTLTVNAVSVDTSGGKTDTSEPTKSEILVRIDGVADEAIVTFNTTTLAEDAFGVQVAGNGTFDNTIKLSDIVVKAEMVDTDGSEVLTFKITGLSEGFSLEGAGVTFMGGSGENRAWLLTEDQLNNATIKVPEHYSCKLPGTLTAITTEKGSGDSWTGNPQEWDVTITPSPESVMVSSTTVVEDTLTKLNFVTDTEHGDSNEVVSTLWILASDVDGKDFTLYLGQDGNKTLADMVTDPNSGVTIEDGYYKLTDGIGNVYVKPGPNFSGGLSLNVKYEVTDYAEDGSGAYTTSEIKGGSHTIVVTPVTDNVELQLNSADPIVNSTGAISVGITLSKEPDAAAGNAPDHDGSELFTQVVISGVPNGMLVEGLKVGDATWGNTSYLGNGKWLISIPTDEYPKFNGPIDGEVMFTGTANMENGNDHKVSITVDTKDGKDGATVSATESWNFDINVPGGGGTADASSVNVTWEKNPDFNGVEDTFFTLSEAFSGNITQTDANGNAVDASVGANFTIVLNLSPGTTVTGPNGPILPIIIDGEEVWVLTGKGQSQLDDYLNNTSITPPANLNDNAEDKFTFGVDFTGHLDNGKQSEAQFGKGEDDFLPLQPVTDKPVIDIAFAALGSDGQPTGNPQEGSDIAITLNVRNDVDIGSVFGDSVYIKVPTGALAGGVMKDANGEALQTSAVSADNGMGLEPGGYYVVSLPAGSTQLDLTYSPPGGKEYTSGDLSLEAWVQSKEPGADNWETGGSGPVTGKVEAINNGFQFAVGHKDSNDVWVDGLVIGNENQSGGSTNAIQLGITGAGLVDTDGSELAITAKLANVPNGFLVYYKDANANLVLATNAGTNDDGNNIWLLPMTGNALPEIFVQPPQNWGGTVKDIQLSVFSGEKGKQTWGDFTKFDLAVNPVADGILSALATPAFGKEGDIIQLNLNIVMKDDQQAGTTDQFVETVTLTLSGLGEHAAFYIGGQLWTEGVVYGEDGVYTLSGLTQDQLDTLGFIQAAGAAEPTIAYTVKTVETSIQDSSVVGSESAPVTGVFDLSIFEQTSTDGNDSLLYGGGLLDGGKGDDTVWLRFGEDLDFTDATLSQNISNIEILDLTKPGYDHQLINLGVDDVANMTDTNNILKINANEGDTISFKQGDWTLDADKSGNDYDVYTGKTTDNKDVEVHITKNVDGLLISDFDTQSIDGLLGGSDTSPATGSTSVPSTHAEMDHDQQNQLINDLIQQGKLATDTQ